MMARPHPCPAVGSQPPGVKRVEAGEPEQPGGQPVGLIGVGVSTGEVGGDDDLDVEPERSLVEPREGRGADPIGTQLR